MDEGDTLKLTRCNLDAIALSLEFRRFCSFYD